jgi:hypothetical protein
MKGAGTVIIVSEYPNAPNFSSAKSSNYDGLFKIVPYPKGGAEGIQATVKEDMDGSSKSIKDA